MATSFDRARASAISSASGIGAVVGVALLAGAAALAAWPLLGPLTRHEQWLCFAIACTAGLTGAIVLRRAPISALLFAVLFLGGIAQLSVTEPYWFSEFRPMLHGPRGIVMFALLGIEALTALVAIAWLYGPNGWRRLLAEAGFTRILLLLALTAIAATSPLRYIGLGEPLAFAWRLVAVGILSAVHVAMVVAIAGAPDFSRLWPGDRWAEVLARRAPLALAVLATIVAGVLSYATFQGIGLVEDETAYLLQAKTIAGGWLAAPPLPAGTEPSFEFYLLEANARGWYATTAPGFPAVLALGVLAGVPWLVNPLLGGIAVLLGQRLTMRWTDRWTANLVALLMATSPWLLETSASMMTHALSLALILGCWVLLSAACDQQRQGMVWAAGIAALAAGLLMGWLFVSRALEGVLIGMLSGLWLVWAVRLAGWRAILLYGAGCLATGVVALAFNAHFTGNPLLSPLDNYLDHLWGPDRNSYGFGKNIGPPSSWGGTDVWRGHSPLEGVVHTWAGVRGLSLELFGWLTGSLLFVWAWLIWSRAGGFARLMAAVAAAAVAAHFFYWYNAVTYIGPRYWYAAFLPLAVVSVAGASAVIARARAAGVTDAERRVTALVVILAVFGLAIFTPWRGIVRYSVESATGGAARNFAEPQAMADAVVFLEQDGYSDAAILNDPYLRLGKPIFVRDLGPAANARVMAAFPGRRPVFLRIDPPRP